MQDAATQLSDFKGIALESGATHFGAYNIIRSNRTNVHSTLSEQREPWDEPGYDCAQLLRESLCAMVIEKDYHLRISIEK